MDLNIILQNLNNPLFYCKKCKHVGCNSNGFISNCKNNKFENGICKKCSQKGIQIIETEELILPAGTFGDMEKVCTGNIKSLYHEILRILPVLTQNDR